MEIGVEWLLPIGYGRFSQRSGSSGGGVEDQDIQPAAKPLNCRNHSFRRLFLNANVRLERKMIGGIGGIQQFNSFGSGPLVGPEDHSNARAGLCQPEGNRAANAAGAAGDESGFIAEVYRYGHRMIRS